MLLIICVWLTVQQFTARNPSEYIFCTIKIVFHMIHPFYGENRTGNPVRFDYTIESYFMAFWPAI